MDLGSKQFIYEVCNIRNVDEKSPELLTEQQLAYAAGTPINVQFQESGEDFEGEIVGYTVGTQRAQVKTYKVILFTDNNDAQMFDNVSCDTIKCRNETEGMKVAAAETENPVDNTRVSDPKDAELSGSVRMEDTSKGPSDSSLLNETRSASSNKIKQPPAATITTESKKRTASPTISSITQDEYGGKEKPASSEPPSKLQKCDKSQSKVASTSNNQQGTNTNNSTLQKGNQTPAKERFPHHPVRTEVPSARAELPTQRQMNPSLQKDNFTPVRAPRPNIPPPPNGQLILEIPQWLKNTPEIRKDLFHHLMGENPAMEMGYQLKSIAFQTNCNINIRGPEFASKSHKEKSKSMLVNIFTKYGHDPPSDPMRARKMVESSICDFVGEDGSKGRLYYDLAASSEQNRCLGSKSNAVFQFNPYERTQRKTCMALFALPSTTVTHQNGATTKKFHGGFLLKGQIKSQINKERCTIILCGDHYKLPTKLCDPYGLIFGDNPAHIDNAIAIVHEHITRHRHSCSCTFAN
jgi:hypothetical protein